MDKITSKTHTKNIAILGSTGNIGQQALDVIEKNRDHYILDLLSAQTNVDLLIHQALKYKPNKVYLGDIHQRSKLYSALAKTHIEILDHEKQVYDAFLEDDIDLVLLAIVGFAGLKPAIQAIQACKNLAIANKESLVVGGQLLMDLAKQKKVQILPVDSEHSAIFQCLQGEDVKSVEKIILTASGGPFYDLSFEEMKNINLKQALQHPTWQMGDKITIDSASMMNKGLEVIEAKWLFDLDVSQIDVVVHPQSYIHSMVQFIDGSVKAQMSPPDMKGPIQYALQFPGRQKSTLTRFNFSDAFELSFKPIDMKKFRNLALAFEALKKGGNMPAILNAANEAAVEAVLQEKLPFFRIAEVVEEMMGQMIFIENPNYNDLIEAHLTTIKKSNQLIRRKK